MFESFLKHSVIVLSMLDDAVKSGQDIETEDLFYRYTFDSIS